MTGFCFFLKIYIYIYIYGEIVDFGEAALREDGM